MKSFEISRTECDDRTGYEISVPFLRVGAFANVHGFSFDQVDACRSVYVNYDSSTRDIYPSYGWSGGINAKIERAIYSEFRDDASDIIAVDWIDRHDQAIRISSEQGARS